MLELSHDQALARDKRRVPPCDIFTVIRNDNELNKLFDGQPFHMEAPFPVSVPSCFRLSKILIKYGEIITLLLIK